MRFIRTSAAFLAAAFVGCATTKPIVEAQLGDWEKRVTAEVPVGTDSRVVKEWFEKQGLRSRATPFDKSDDMEIFLGSVPAKEWYCGKWMLRVVVRVAGDGKVAAYDFDALGECL